MDLSRVILGSSLLAIVAGGVCAVVVAQQPARQPATLEQRMAQFRESPAEEAAKQVVLTRFKLRQEGKYMELMKYLSEDFTEHMTPARMSKNGKTAYQNQLEQAQRMSASPTTVDPAVANYPVQARASEDLVTLFHAFGCDIFRVKNGKVSDHWDCTPWEPFSNVGERKQIEDQVKAEQAKAAAATK
ncbi:MAG: hypothetical protein QM808_05815 [Steroidobacteraceae bacterium]